MASARRWSAARGVSVLREGAGEMEQRNVAATVFYCLVLWVQVLSSGFFILFRYRVTPTEMRLEEATAQQFGFRKD